ncbi:SbcC/MukB-like Walker B domain-containing protein [Virgibacillus halodenitrificans]|uniref:SbcC/MukB-like Walker B domain-containing protein n=1 Tax=Virgibacillus halodenitrificans TaxID=1482 RepID=UPI0024C06B70|nr:SbcC/MukB-like Walker B domain-containing protein [Virgibacillus halodenitrificans]WHX24927.1 SbcC/MukB-like Walker B domain-containing protein [Virgibacillus halodenitrificans]
MLAQTKRRIAPIRLLSIESEGFSYFPRQEVIFHEKITAGVGENGSGKTTFNNMVRLLFGASKFDNGHSLRTFFERNDVFEIYVLGRFDNSFQKAYNMRPFDPIGKKQDVVTVVCRLIFNDPSVKRNYYINDGEFDLEKDLKKTLRWLEVEQFHRQFHEVGISKALIRSFSLSQGNTEEVLKKDEEGLANYLLDICGEQERIDEFNNIKKRIGEQQQQFQALAEQKELEEARVRQLQQRIERCKQINDATKQIQQYRFDLPISQYAQYLDDLENSTNNFANMEEQYKRLYQDIQNLMSEQIQYEKEAPIIEGKYTDIKAKLKTLQDQKVAFEIELSELKASLAIVADFLKQYENIEPVDEKELQAKENAAEKEYEEATGTWKVIDREKEVCEKTIQRLEEQGAVEFPKSVQQMIDTLKGSKVEHLLIADYIEILDESWRQSIEALLGSERFTITVSDKAWVNVMKLAQQQKYPFWISPFNSNPCKLHEKSVLNKVKVLDDRIMGYLKKFEHYMVCDTMEEAYEWGKKGKSAILNHPYPYKVVERGGRAIKESGIFCGKEAYKAQLKETKSKFSQLIPRWKQAENTMNSTKKKLKEIQEIIEIQKQVRIVPAKKVEMDDLSSKKLQVQNNLNSLAVEIELKHASEEDIIKSIKTLHSNLNRIVGIISEKESKKDDLLPYLQLEEENVNKAKVALNQAEEQLTMEQVEYVNNAEYLENIATIDFYHQTIKELENRIKMLRNISNTDIILVGEEQKMIRLEQKYKQHQKVLQNHRDEIEQVKENLGDLEKKHALAEQEYHTMVEEVFTNIRKSLQELSKETSIQADLRAFHIGEEKWKVDYRIGFHGKEMNSYRNKARLSGGQKAIASLLLTFAAIRSDGGLSFMILDEPFAHLDQERINVAGEFLRQTGVQFFIAMPYSENVKLLMPWVDMQVNFRPKRVSEEVAPPITYGVINDEYLAKRNAI